ncbi:flagellin N-terminal helical domain-containing protein [Shinella sp.]|uniref:flagellin N-terminal helical domain-containing protein n=1 Tax=Shinella sp. TaxID=1870904 RepID=UPI003F708134
MTSILTNIAAMTALQTLRSIGSNMEETQARVSSGLRVAGAADNAAYWSIATTMRSDNLALSAVQDALGLGAAKVDTAYAAMDSAIEVVKEIKSKLVAATEEGIDKAKIQEELTQLQDQLKSIAESASFSGENWVAGEDAVEKSVVSGFVRSADDTVSVKTTTYTFNSGADGNVLFGHDGTDIDFAAGILGTAGAVSGTAVIEIELDDTMTPADIGEFLSDVETSLSAMTSAAAELGSISMRIGLQEDFVSKLTDSIDSGVGRLVDADMNEESTRLKALQTQQQLAIQSLSIANSSSEGILQLFR